MDLLLEILEIDRTWSCADLEVSPHFEEEVELDDPQEAPSNLKFCMILWFLDHYIFTGC